MSAESSDAASGPRTGVVADDLTGAMDTAGAFASRGPQARAPVADAARTLLAQGFGRIYKKIDSTLRGNVAAECAAVVEATDAKVAIVCPAFPQMGRTLIQGRLRLHGSPLSWPPLSGTQKRNDLGSEPASDSLIELLRLEGEVDAGLVAIATVRQGSAAIEAEIRKLIDQGRNAIVVDAETEGHLASIAAAGPSASTDSVMVGSAGLAYALADDADAAGRVPVAPGSDHGPVVVVAGSAHQCTRTQLSILERGRLVTPVPMSPLETLDSRESRAGHARDLVSAVGAQLKAGRHVALFWSDGGDEIGAAGTSAADADILASFAGLVVYGALRVARVAGLVVAGGDTAFDVLRSLGASSIDVLGEVETGVPFGLLNEGIARGVTLVTKAGGFGDPHTLARALEFVTGLSSVER